ncbi:glycosyl transferase family 1 [Bacillus safensis]|uniref:teichuronic acid biosynthesis protein TuaC n=1 Tax=Bacillus safensis TaxID=561879 RepID=UPI000651F964|nr:glycosyltransferase family 4 protein [Bacillus safensis]KML11022.1 glycosyl transferase family 1 [Bacillus safensis]KML53131.1 glycosyl transferase family 1 [Bacillus safensis]KMN79397.1 glycosyl transferase family 1 [Bacillus safensis]
MKVLWLTSVYPSEKHPSEGVFHETQVQELLKQGIEVTVICPNPVNPPVLRMLKASYRQKRDLPEQEVRNGVTVYRPPYPALPGQLKWAQPSKRIAASVLRAMQRHQLSPDFIHAHFAMPSGGAAAVIQKETKIPYLLTLHGSDVNVYPGFSKGAQAAFETAVKQASAVLTVSEELAKKTNEMTKVEATCLPLGIPLQSFSITGEDQEGIRKHLGLPLQDKLVVFVGRLVKEKGLLELADAVSSMDGVKAVFVGKGPLAKELSERAGASIILPGQVPNEQVREYLMAADLFTLPSYSEGMPTVVLEALALKVPVIATRVGGLPSLFSTYQHLLVEPRSTRQLKEAIHACLYENRWNEQVKNDLYEMVHTEYSSEHNAKHLIQQYEKVLNQSTSIV